jgi:hypothetical protein
MGRMCLTHPSRGAAAAALCAALLLTTGPAPALPPARDAQPALPPPGNSQPAPAPGKSKEAAAAIEGLLKKGKLELSTRPQSAAEAFQFYFAAQILDGKKSVSTNWHVVRDGKRVAVVARAGDDVNSPPFFYMTEGLFVVVDASNPGGLAVAEGGRPAFSLGSGPQGQMFDCSFRWGAKAPEDKDNNVDKDDKDERPMILVDAGALLGDLLSHARRSEYDAAKGIVTLRTEHLTAKVLIPPKEQDRTVLGFRELLVGGGGNAVHLSIPPTAKPTADYFSVTKEAVMALGLPVRKLSEGKAVELEEAEAMKLMFPPPDFLKDPKMRQTSEKLGGLLKPRSAAP